MSNLALIRDVEFKALRIPYNDALESFGIDNVGWKVLQESIFPNAETLDSIVMALAYCRRRSLDVFKRPVHIVPMWSTAAKKMIDTVWPSIAELRTTAFRTGAYAGRDATEYGPERNETVGKTKIIFPEWAQVTVYRIVSGVRCAFPGPRVYWLESYAKAKRDDDSPNSMWQRRPHGQLDKCAEAAALRAAFPEEIGGEYAAEEMEGQAIVSERDMPSIPARRAPPPPPQLVSAPLLPEPQSADAGSGAPPPGSASDAPRRAPPPPAAAEPKSSKPDYGATIRAYTLAVGDAKDIDDVETSWREHIDPIWDNLLPHEADEVAALDKSAREHFAP